MRLKYSFTFARPSALSAKKSIDSPINRHVLVTGIRHQSNAWKPDPANAADNSIENSQWGRWESNWSAGKSWCKQDGSAYCWHVEGRRRGGELMRGVILMIEVVQCVRFLFFEGWEKDLFVHRQLSPWDLYTTSNTSPRQLPELAQPWDFAGRSTVKSCVASVGRIVGLEWPWEGWSRWSEGLQGDQGKGLCVSPGQPGAPWGAHYHEQSSTGLCVSRGCITKHSHFNLHKP